MPLISLRQLLDHAAENNYGIPAFNINNLEQVRAIMEGAKELNSPVILQASKAARKYAGPIFVKKMVEAAMEEFSEIPTVLHQDHGGSPEDCKNCIELGFTSVMMDGSLKEDQKTPSDFEYNVRVTKKTVDIAHSSGVSVEGEIGCLGSLETGTGEKEDGVGAEGVLSHDQLLTDPDEASNFVDQTNVDALAIAIGTSHGAYKFSKPPTGETLAMDRIKEIHSRLPNTHLVMHGSSSVPQELISEWIGSESGIIGIFIATFFGVLIPSGPIVAFPIAIALFNSGAGVTQLVAFLTGWSIFQFSRLLIWEVPFLGWQFASRRLLLSISLPFIAAGISSLLIFIK